MRYHTITLNDEEINFRLTAEDCVKIEEQTKTKLLDYIQDYSMITIINLLRYMRRGEKSDFSQKDAHALFDKLADNDWALEDIMKKIVFPTARVSGLLTKSDLETILERMENKEAQNQQQATE